MVRRTTAQPATLHGVHPIQITLWKKQLLAGAAGAFGVKPDPSQATLATELFEASGGSTGNWGGSKKLAGLGWRAAEPTETGSPVEWMVGAVQDEGAPPGESRPRETTPRVKVEVLEGYLRNAHCAPNEWGPPHDQENRLLQKPCNGSRANRGRQGLLVE